MTASSGTGRGDRPLTLSDFLAGTRGTEQASQADARLVEALDALHSALADLTPKQRFVVSRLWGLEDQAPCSERELAAVLGCSRRSVRDLHARAVSRLGSALGPVLAARSVDPTPS